MRITRSDKPTFWMKKSLSAMALVLSILFVCAIAVMISSSTTRAFAADETAVLVGAGDIAKCDQNGDSRTAQILGTIPGTIFTTGDNAYDSGTYAEYLNCYGPTWGQYKDRTMPVPGNHEYETAGAPGYYRYFNVPEYYAYDQGTWRIYALNSEIDTSATSAQVQWLQADLAQNPRSCVMAYWHRPLWSSGNHHGGDNKMQVIWNILFDANAELVITGHEHNYERFSPMNKTGQAVPVGLQEIVVGTGGANKFGFGNILPASQVRNANTYGVIKLTLSPGKYDWQFVPVAGGTFTDYGSQNCH
jgi:acid phosphatase type 7